MGLGIAAGFAAARMLLREELPGAIPEPLRMRLQGAQTSLHQLRARAREAIEAGRVASQQAEREMVAEYRRRAGRS